MTEISAEERAARERAEVAHMTGPDIEIPLGRFMWQAAHDYLTGKGYTPRSMLRLQAAKDGVCRICGKPTEQVPMIPATVSEEMVERAAKAMCETITVPDIRRRWERCSVNMKTAFRMEARAALELYESTVLAEVEELRKDRDSWRDQRNAELNRFQRVSEQKEWENKKLIERAAAAEAKLATKVGEITPDSPTPMVPAIELERLREGMATLGLAVGDDPVADALSAMNDAEAEARHERKNREQGTKNKRVANEYKDRFKAERDKAREDLREALDELERLATTVGVKVIVAENDAAANTIKEVQTRAAEFLRKHGRLPNG